MDRVDYEYLMRLVSEAAMNKCSVAQVVMLRIENHLRYHHDMGYLRGYLWIY